MTQVLPVTGEPAVAHRSLPLIMSLIASAVIAGFAWLNWPWISDALVLVGDARWSLLAAALGLILLSYLVSSQVFLVALRSMGRDLGVMRLWATTLTAIVISQSVPAGGAGSYAFLLHAFRRRRIPPGEAALLAALEALSYVGAMSVIGVFSVIYILSQVAGGLGIGGSAGTFAAAFIGLSCLAVGIVVLTRDEQTLRRWSTPIGRGIARLRRQRDDEKRTERLVAELVRGRSLVTARPMIVVGLVLIQIAALVGHSLALLLVLMSLGANASMAVALAAFGVALLTSTFNVLPGGGGTVETVLAAILMQFAIGPAAIPAAILFRLLNFWALVPVAIAGYMWVHHGQAAKTANP